MTRLLLAPLLALSVCAPNPPLAYTEDCSPVGETFYLDLMQDGKHRAELPPLNSDPEIAQAELRAWYEDRGYNLRTRKEMGDKWRKLVPPGLASLFGALLEDGFAITLPGVVIVPDGWETRSTISQLRTERHEAVHIAQYQDLGVRRFFDIYAYEDGRWALEAQAYKESFYVSASYGTWPTDVEQKAMNVRDKYSMGSLPETCVRGWAVELWDGS